MQTTTARHRISAATGLLLASLLLGACGGPGATGTAAPSTTAGPTATRPTASPSAAAPTTTETDWGTIWDEVPAGFPVPDGARPTESNEAVSAAWSASGRPAAITTGMVTALEAAGWSIESASEPYEDGSQVIDAVRGSPECRTQVTVAPRGDEVLVMVRYAAACPWQ